MAAVPQDSRNLLHGMNRQQLSDIFGFSDQFIDQNYLMSQLSPKSRLDLEFMQRQGFADQFGAGRRADLALVEKNERGALMQSMIKRGLYNSSEAGRQSKLQGTEQFRRRGILEDQITQIKMSAYGGERGGFLVAREQAKKGRSAGREAAVLGAVGNIAGGFLGGGGGLFGGG